MDSPVLVLSHVLISLIGILSGFVVLRGLLTATMSTFWTRTFLMTTVVTSASGYLFHRDHILPSQIVGAISLVLMAGVLAALYRYRLKGHWRVVYVVGAVMCLYFNVFVGVIQAFLKVPALHALAPQGSEPPFAIAQGLVLVLFIIAGVLSVKRFHPGMDSLSGQPARAAWG